MGLEGLTIPPEMLAGMRTHGTSRPQTCEEIAQKQVEIYNRTLGLLTGLDCGNCLNRGNVMYLDEDGNRRLRECECMSRRRSVRRIQKSGLGDMLEAYTFAKYQTPEAWQKKAKAAAQQFLADCNGKWLVAAGAVGSGKTHLCTAICGELLNGGREVRYMLWRDDGGRIKAAVNDTEEYARLLDPLKTASVLYIDDFFKGKVTDGDIHLAFELLNYRYNNRRMTTIISTEKTVEEITSLDEGVGSRIYERSKEYYLRNTGSERNWRLRA